jgi:hypothetical protein
MKTRTRILFAMAIASVLAVLTALLLLNGNVSVAIWMEGPYFPLTLLLPGSVDTLATMVVVVAAYYFVSSLVALKYSSRLTVVLVVSIVIAVNTLGAYAWHRLADRSASADGRTAPAPRQPNEPRGSGVSWHSRTVGDDPAFPLSNEETLPQLRDACQTIDQSNQDVRALVQNEMKCLLEELP